MLKYELISHDINVKGNQYEIQIGDENITVDSLAECREHIEQGISELKYALFDLWKDLEKLADKISCGGAFNEGGLDNIVFLHSVKKSYLLSTMFSQLKNTTATIKKVFEVDISNISPEDINNYNSIYIKIRLLHYMIMSEIYRLLVIGKYSSFIKEAQISGPWANLDLDMQERVWPYSEDDDYFAERQKWRRSQARYNPETIEGAGSHGYYFIWQDFTRDPYRFEDMQKDSPYKSRSILTIP